MRRALVAMLEAIAVLAIFVVGVSGVALSYLPDARQRLAFDEPDTFFTVGIGLTSFAVLLAAAFWALHRGRYLHIGMGAKVAPQLLHKTLETCFQANFPKQVALEWVDLSHNKIEIAIRLTPMEAAQREALYRSAEQQLKQLLSDQFGYINPFYLTVKT